MAKSPAALSLPKIDLTEKSLDVRLRLKGKPAVDLADYQQAYQAAHGVPVDLEVLVAFILNRQIEEDRSFQTWRRGRSQEEGRSQT